MMASRFKILRVRKMTVFSELIFKHAVDAAYGLTFRKIAGMDRATHGYCDWTLNSSSLLKP